MEYSRDPLVQAFRELARAYDEFLGEWQIQHLSESIQLLDVIQGTLPGAHATLRSEAVALRDYDRLLREQLFRPSGRIGGYRLPALERSVELLDHLGVQFEPFNWRFSLSIAEDGVSTERIAARFLSLANYRPLQLQTAVYRDFRADLERFVRDPACLGLLTQLKAVCDGTGERLTLALKIWSDHATGP
jgi:hypothetical protein